MRCSSLVMFFTVAVLGISNVVEGQEWVPYEGEVPENAMWTSPNARPPHPICRKNGRPNGWIGWMDEEEGICHTMGRSASYDDRPIRVVDWTADNQRRAYRSDRGWTKYKPLRKAGSFEIMLAPDPGYAAWVPYKGEVPENALWTSPRKLAPHPICRMHKQGNGWIGWMDEETGVCHTMGFNASNDKKRKIARWTADDTNNDGQGFEILVNAVGDPGHYEDQGHDGDQGFWCAICNIGFATAEEMDAHAAEAGHTDGDGGHYEDHGDYEDDGHGSVFSDGHTPEDHGDYEDQGHYGEYAFDGCTTVRTGRMWTNRLVDVDTGDSCHDAAVNGGYSMFGLSVANNAEKNSMCYLSNKQVPRIVGDQCQEATDDAGHFLGSSHSIAIYQRLSPKSESD